MTLSLSLSHMAYVSYELFRLLRISALFFKFVGKNRAKKNPLFWGWIPGKLPYFQCSMLTAMNIFTSNATFL